MIIIDSLYVIRREWNIEGNNFHIANILVLDLNATMYMWIPAILGYVTEASYLYPSYIDFENSL